MKARKKPIVVEVAQFTRESILASTPVEKRLPDWVMEKAKITVTEKIHNSERLVIQTLEGDMTASIGDWIIKGVNGEVYPCKPDIFEKTYEIVD